jgi:hypothetical protein
MQLMREGYHERLFLLTDEREGVIVRKQAKSTANGTLLTEITWLEELPPALHRYFPRVLRSSKGNGNGQAVFYDMPYFGQEWAVLSELILTGALDHPQALMLIAQVMQVMFEGIFPIFYPEEEAEYAEKLVCLLEYWVERIFQLPSFLPFSASKRIVVNDEKLWNVFPLLDILKGESRLREALRPAAVRKVHGDLHPENVLVHIPSLRRPTPQVMLLDPIAAIGLSRGDFAMDIAKFKSWLSAELLALRLGWFSIQPARRDIPAFWLTLHTWQPQLNALSDRTLLREFMSLFGTRDWVKPVCDSDPSWWQRVCFYEALYALSMVPLVPAPQDLARFLVGIRHLNGFVRAVDHR